MNTKVFRMAVCKKSVTPGVLLASRARRVNRTMQSSELRLVLEAIAGNAASFGELADFHGPAVVGLAYSLTGDLEAARDLTQETFLRAYISLHTLQRPDRFGSWLRQIAANLARSYWRQSGRRRTLPLEVAGDAMKVLQGLDCSALEADVPVDPWSRSALHSPPAPSLRPPLAWPCWAPGRLTKRRPPAKKLASCSQGIPGRPSA